MNPTLVTLLAPYHVTRLPRGLHEWTGCRAAKVAVGAVPTLRPGDGADRTDERGRAA